MNRATTVAFYLIALSLGGAFILPLLFSDGMFSDGLLYSLLGRNMALGKGSFWYPNATETFFYNFHEHPPLVFGLEAILFYVFGDSIYIERFYSLITLLLSLTGIHLIWRLMVRYWHIATPNTSWLPILLFFVIPSIAWSFSNNMLENTVTVFTIFSIYLSLRALETSKNQVLLLTCSSLCILGGILTKGPVALFPIATPFIFWLTTRKISFLKATTSTLLLLAIFGGILTVLLSNYEARLSLNQYWNQQVIASLNGSRDVNGNHFYLLGVMGLDLSLLILFCLGAVVVYKLQDWPITAYYKSMSFLLLTALSASIPMLLSPKQLSHYTIPSYPYFCLFAAVLCWPILQLIIEYTTEQTFKIIRIISYAFTTIVFVATIYVSGTPLRDQELLHDVYYLKEKIPQNSILRATEAVTKDYKSYYYFYRLHDVSLIYREDSDHTYFLSRSHENYHPQGYKKLDYPLEYFSIYKRQHD